MFQLSGGIGLSTPSVAKHGIGLSTPSVARPWYTVARSRIQRITTHSYFTGFIMSIIGINAIKVGIEASIEGKGKRRDFENDFEVVENVFLSIYTVEFLLKVIAEPKDFWKSNYNKFDFFILLSCYFDLILNQAGSIEGVDGVLSNLRIIRAARILRTISFVEGLHVLFEAVGSTLKSVFNLVALLLMLMFFFSIIGYYCFGYDHINDDWDTLPKAMLTLFVFVTADGWTKIQDRMTLPGSEWFTIVFIVLAHFIFFNLFIGLFILKIHEATEYSRQAQRKERELQLKMKKEYLYKRQHDDVRKMLEQQKKSKYGNFEEMTKEFYETLRHDDYVIMTDVSTNLMWLETFLTSLDHMDVYTYRVQQSHRNLACIIGEMAERSTMRMYGLSPDDTSSSDVSPYPSLSNVNLIYDNLTVGDDDRRGSILKDPRRGSILKTPSILKKDGSKDGEDVKPVKKRKLSRLRKYSIDSTKSEKSVTFSTQDQLKQPEISIAAVPSIVINSGENGNETANAPSTSQGAPITVPNNNNLAHNLSFIIEAPCDEED